MKTCPTTRRVTRLFDHDQLASVVVRLEHDLREDDPGHGLVTFAVLGTDAEGVSLAIRHHDVADPIDALVAVTAPDDWVAFGVVTRGRSRPLLDAGPRLRTDVDATPSPVRMAMAVDRAGRAVSGLRTLDGPFTVRDDLGEVSGRVPDGCRRVLGLCTAPPEVPVEDFFALLWLDQVLAEAVARPGALSWAEAAGMHFGAGLVTELVADGAHVGPVEPDEALMIGHALTADQTSWAFVRDRVARLDEPNALFDPRLAAWMDDGMFSREVLSGLPPTDLMLEALEEVAPPAVLRAVVRTIAGWQLV